MSKFWARIMSNEIDALKLFVGKENYNYFYFLATEDEFKILATNGLALLAIRILDERYETENNETENNKTENNEIKNNKKDKSISFGVPVGVLIDKITYVDINMDTEKKIAEAKIVLKSGQELKHNIDTENIYVPNFKAIMPAKVSFETAQFDIKYLNLFYKASVRLFGKKDGGHVYISHNGSSAPALVSFSVDTYAFGLLMPHKIENTSLPESPPEWLK